MEDTSDYGYPPKKPYFEIQDIQKGNLPLEVVDDHKLADQGKNLNIAAHDPQSWPQSITIKQ